MVPSFGEAPAARRAAPVLLRVAASYSPASHSPASPESSFQKLLLVCEPREQLLEEGRQLRALEEDRVLRRPSRTVQGGQRPSRAVKSCPGRSVAIGGHPRRGGLRRSYSGRWAAIQRNPAQSRAPSACDPASSHLKVLRQMARALREIRRHVPGRRGSGHAITPSACDQVRRERTWPPRGWAAGRMQKVQPRQRPPRVVIIGHSVVGQ